MRRVPFALLAVALPVALLLPAVAQIGGRTPSDGVFLLEDVEDLDLVAGGVDRRWVPEFVWGGGLEALPLEGSGLVLLPGQSPVGALRYRLPVEYGFVSKSFGVPMPSEPGESTLSHPGNIAGFDSLEFLIAFTPALAVQEFWVILETYPEMAGGKFPRVMWQYEPEAGNAFQRVTIPLHEPTLILDGEDFAVEELLSQTRFLSFYFYAESARFPPARMDVHVDDIILVPKTTGTGSMWILSDLNEDVMEDAAPGGGEATG